MKYLLFVPLALGLLVALLALVGTLLPREHTATRVAAFRQPPAVIYAAVRDFAGQSAWRSAVKAVELLPPRAGAVSYREIGRDGAVTYVVREERPGEKLVVEIADENLPYGGRWIFTVHAAGRGSELRIAEEGFVKNVIFRCLARFVFGYTGTMETYLRDLGKKFGEPVTPAP